MSSAEFAVRWKGRVPLAGFARQYGIPGVVVFALLLLRRHEQLMHPQVWDEDGTIIVRYLIEQGPSAVLVPFAGYLTVVPGLIAALSLSISFLYYHVVSTVVAWAFIVGVGLTISMSATRMAGGVALAAAALLVPSDPEVIGIPLYTFWWAALLLFITALWRDPTKALAWRLAFVVLGGLSSPTIIMVAPILIARAVVYRSVWAERIVAVAGCSCAAIQAAIMLRAGVASQNLGSLAASIPWIPSKFLGNYLIGNLTYRLGSFHHVLLVVVGLSTAALAIAVLYRNRGNPTYLILAYLWGAGIFLAMSRLPIFEDGLDPATGFPPRYFFFPFVLEAWFLIQVAWTENSLVLRTIAASMLVVAVANAVPALARAHHDDLSWRENAATCAHFPQYAIPIEYDGRREFAWHLTLSGKQCAALAARDPLRGLGPIPVFPYSNDSTASPTASLAGLVTTSSIVSDGWHGTDQQGAGLGGLRVSVSAGASVGRMTLRLQRGDRVLFRSGADTARQRLIIGGKAQTTFSESVPAARVWTVLDFSNDMLPQSFDATFVDEGTGAAEWSAIAVRLGSQSVGLACRDSTKVLARAFGDGRVDAVSIDGSPAQLNGKVEAGRSSTLVIDGWATDRRSRPASGVCAVVDGRVLSRTETTLGVRRPDVAAAFATALTTVGYRATVPLDSLRPGVHKLEMAQFISPASVVPLPGPITLVVH